MEGDEPAGPLVATSDEGARATERVPALPDPRAARWALLRDVLVLQAKLILDGLKDIVLAPASIVAALVGLVFEPHRPGRHFYELLRAGRDFDRWLDLYGADEGGARSGEAAGFDAHVRRLEAILVEQHRHGGVTRQAKDAIDQAIDALQAAREDGEVDPPGPRV